MNSRLVFQRVLPQASSVRYISKYFRKTKPQVYSEFLESAINPKAKKLDAEERVDPKTGTVTTYSNWSHEVELFAFAHRVGYDPQQLPSLLEAVTAKGYEPIEVTEEVIEHQSQQSNGTLAVLGRSITLMFVREFLYFTYPNLPGESMLQVDLALTGSESLAKVCERLGLADIILTRPLGLDEKRTPLEAQDILSNALLAVVGAVYFDQGAEEARKFVHNFILPQLTLNQVRDIVRLKKPKGTLTTMLKQQSRGPAESRLLRESGRLTHFPTFVVGIFSDQKIIGQGVGTSLDRAEKEAMNAAIVSHIMKETKTPNFPPLAETEKEDESDFIEVTNH
ncbi:ribonuclease 3-like [Dysidea avara]|uniref:ribonuclease 3-like n=1 Tax=Dysidea avara TaxID=196820 RepID=UPI00331F6954